MRTKSNHAGLMAGITVAALLGLAIVTIYQMRTSAEAAANSLTLDPEMFQGEVHDAYIAAQRHPELLAQLDCYCGCEQHEGHKSLLDCYRTNHAATCATCTGEAVTGAQLYENGTPVEQIREVLRQRYAHGG